MNDYFSKVRDCAYANCVPEKTEAAPEGSGGWPGSWKWAECPRCGGYFKVSGFCMEPEKCRGGSCTRDFACND